MRRCLTSSRGCGWWQTPSCFGISLRSRHFAMLWREILERMSLGIVLATWSLEEMWLDLWDAGPLGAVGEARPCRPAKSQMHDWTLPLGWAAADRMGQG